MEVASKINQKKKVFHKQRNIKKCYCCGSGTQMLNSCKIKDKYKQISGLTGQEMCKVITDKKNTKEKNIQRIVTHVRVCTLQKEAAGADDKKVRKGANR